MIGEKEYNFTHDDLKKLFEMYDNLVERQRVLSENIKTAQDRNGERVVKYENANGEVVDVKEIIIWNVELKYNRDKALKYISDTYPEIYKMHLEEQKMVNDIEKFELEIFGFNRKQLTLANYIKLTQKLIKLELGKNEG